MNDGWKMNCKPAGAWSEAAGAEAGRTADQASAGENAPGQAPGPITRRGEFAQAWKGRSLDYYLEIALSPISLRKSPGRAIQIGAGTLTRKPVGLLVVGMVGPTSQVPS